MNKIVVGVRREDKNEWERRVPFTPNVIRELREEDGVEFLVQTSPIRIYPDQAYREAGARVDEDLSPAELIFAVKEIPIELIEANKAYVFFSHTIKGQSYNMPLLQKILDSKATLVDYERIVDDKDRRLVFFGVHAGYAGMIDTLHLLGKRHASLGKKCRFQHVKMAYEYESLEQAKTEIGSLADDIRERGFPTPIVFGFTGYGNVSQGAQEILAQLPVEEITPEECLTLRERVTGRTHCVYKVVFHEEHMAERKDGKPFELKTYYNHPQMFQSRFAQYVPHLNVLVNCIYWTEDYPRLVTRDLLKSLYEKGVKKPEVIGDISIDIEGAIECSYKATHSDNPSYVYEPLKDRFVDGVEGDGPVILAVDNLPCELPRESSQTFSRALKGYVPQMASADWSVPFEQLDIPAPIRAAVIAHRGELAPEYRYLKEFLGSE